MNEIIKANLPFIKEEITAKEALKLFAEQPYKIELIEDLGADKVTIYKQGDFVDLCRGPQLRPPGTSKHSS